MLYVPLVLGQTISEKDFQKSKKIICMKLSY